MTKRHGVNERSNSLNNYKYSLLGAACQAVFAINTKIFHLIADKKKSCPNKRGAKCQCPQNSVNFIWAKASTMKEK